MKTTIKVLGLVVLLGGVICIASCSKKKTCTCTVTVTIYGHTYSETATGEIDSGSCADAENMPEVQQAKEALGGYGTFDVSCH